MKAILFDFDGVLTIDKSGSTTITRYIAKETNIPLSLIKASYYKFNEQLLIGEITHEDMWKSFCNEVGEDIDYQVLVDSFIHTALDSQIFEYIKELKKTYYIGMVTDNKADRIKTILDYTNYGDYFDVVAVSAELHARKDTKQIFQHVLDQLCVEATDCVFIDNTKDNLVIPEKMGMKTILFDDENRDFEKFQKLLNTILLIDC